MVSGLTEQLLVQGTAVFVFSLCPSLQAYSQIHIFFRDAQVDTGCYRILSERPYSLSYYVPYHSKPLGEEDMEGYC